MPNYNSGQFPLATGCRENGDCVVILKRYTVAWYPPQSGFAQ